MTEKDIQIESGDLNICYVDSQALKNVSMNVPANKVTAVIDPARRQVRSHQMHQPDEQHGEGLPHHMQVWIGR